MRFNDILGGLFGRKRGPRSPSTGQGGVVRRHISADDRARQEQFRKAASQYHGVFSEEFARTLEAADHGLTFPDAPQDVLEYLGNIEPLGLSEEEKSVAREWTREVVEERGLRAVWDSRLRLKLELRYLTLEAGLQVGHHRPPQD
jgi:hypothetical protein